MKNKELLKLAAQLAFGILDWENSKAFKKANKKLEKIRKKEIVKFNFTPPNESGCGVAIKNDVGLYTIFLPSDAKAGDEYQLSDIHGKVSIKRIAAVEP